ncbi:putative permease [Synechococcus sp. MIT S9509]|uniref:permease n=1 Tax=unclassified Synechococcus TaxID=2626047 RepID=UPI0007BB74FF|nr:MULTISPECIES: permease [unclassified Synechococcus]KZR85307.1 putative permease [Synechococcus sp. MIT S9504]KZR91458.1 putative permease [Synechococcus sp. MIT S9509]
MTRLATAWAIFQGLLIEALPFLMLGVTIAGVARWLVPQSAWVRRLPSNPLLAPIVGALLGFALPACECGNVPVARRLLASGAPLGTGFGFLFAAPVLNPIVLASTWAAFPDKTWLLWARPAGAFLIALALSALLGLIPESRLLQAALLEERRLSQPLSSIGLLERRTGMVGAGPAKPEMQARSSAPQPRELLSHSTREFLSLLTLLVLGSALAAVVQTWLPRSWLLALGSAPTLSILALMVLALVVSVCSSVDAFLALGFAAQVTPGALLAFLLLGPVVDLKLAGLFTVLLSSRAIAITALSASLMVLLIGQWVNLIQL